MVKIKRNDHLIISRLPKHARDLILFIKVREHGRKTRNIHFVKSEKPNIHFRHYKNYRMLIRLRQWCMTSQARSLMQAQYASHPRNPE